MDVFFETITYAHWPLVAWHVFRGARIFVFDFTHRLKSVSWLRRWINNGTVQRVYVHPNSRADALAIDATEQLFPRFADDVLIRLFSSAFGAEEVAPAFKKALLGRLFKYFFVRLYLEKHLETAGQGRRVVLIPETFRQCARLFSSDAQSPLRGVRMPPGWAAWSEVGTAAKQLIMTYSICLVSGITIAGSWLGKRCGIVKPLAPQHGFEHLYAIDQVFQTQFTGARRFDFLLDGKGVNKDNTAFLVHWRAEGPWMDEARKAGYRVILRRWWTHPTRMWRYPPHGLNEGLFAQILLHTLWRHDVLDWIPWAATVGMLVALQESILMERVRCENYIYMNQDGLAQCWRNVLLRRAGTQSWCFAFSIGGGYLYGTHHGFLDGRDFGDRHRWWAYQNQDHFVGTSQRMIEYYRQHPQFVRSYYNVGNIWSESVRQAQLTNGLDTLRRRWFDERAQGRKIIAWFDTTFVEAGNCPSTLTEAIRWYRDIQRLLAERDDLAMLIKPSKAESWFTDNRSQWWHPLGLRVAAQWHALRRHPRVYFAGHTEDPADIIAVSDLCITYCFSSVSAEALGARKRAIWYEPGDRWRETLYGRESLLVAHGYRELRALVRRLLDDITDEEYEDYLEQQIKGLVDDFVDGRGLSRFRTLLTHATRQAENGHDDTAP